MNTSESIGDLATALAKAQATVAGAKKDADNPFFKSKYADLASVVEAIRKAFADNGLSYVQTPCTNDKDEVGVETLLMHSSGQWIKGDPFFVPVSKQDAQGFGSALTYTRRYALAAIAGVAQVDDDGNAAAKAPPGKKPAFDRSHTPMADTKDEFGKLSLDQQQWYRDEAEAVMECFRKKGDLHAHIEDRTYSTEDKLFLWLLLPSDCRSAIKEAQKTARTKEVA